MTIWQTIKKHPSALFWALFVHVLAFIAIGISFKTSSTNISAVKPEKVIEAVAIDENKVNAEINKLKKAEDRKKQQQLREQKRLQAKAQKAKKERLAEEKKLRAIKKEQQKQAQLNKKQAELNKKKEQAEKKRLADIEKKTKEQEQKQLEAQRKIDELEKKRQQKEEQLKKEEQARKDAIAEKKRAAQEKQRINEEQKQIAKYESLIKNQITSKWIFPASYQKGMRCKVLVRLIPSGDVISVQITQSSGNVAFDNSVEMAVNKASPLPVPDASSKLFEHFREVEFVFDPNG